MSSTSKLLNVKVPAPKRSMFDLSRPNRMTLSAGLAYPCLVEEILPGDDINLSVETRLKSHATLAPILGMFDCTYYHFFCPLRNYVPGMTLNMKRTEFRDEFDLPTFTVPQSSGSVFYVGTGSLLDYLGLPVGFSGLSADSPEDRTFNAVPLLAYYDIWRNYFANPQSDFVEMYTGFTQVNENDLFTHSRDEIAISELDDIYLELLNGVTDFNDIWTSIGFSFATLFNIINPAIDTVENRRANLSVNSHAGLLPVTYHDDMFVSRLNTSYVDYVKQQVVVDTSSGSFSIDSLRMANKLAKFIDKSIFGGTRYGQWLKSHFAVNGMEHLNIPIFLGMDRMSLFFDDVVSKAQTGQGDNGELGSTGGRASVHYPNTNNVEFYAKEHGVLMSIVVLRPRVEYFQGIPKMYQKTKFSDIYVPELDAVGWQPILRKDLYANTLITNVEGSNFDMNEIVGYSPAWIEYMTSVGSVHGQFATSLDYWVLLRRFGVVKYDEEGVVDDVELDVSTYVNPEDYNYPFAGVEDYHDNFYLNQLFNLTIGRNISKQILPTL